MAKKPKRYRKKTENLYIPATHIYQLPENFPKTLVHEYLY